MGDSKWGFYLNKNIDAEILDKGWLEKVRTRKIKNLYSGVKIPVKMLIEVELDDNGIPIKDSEKYKVLEVTGNIIEPLEQDGQLDILDMI
jgi:hypothetical protein